MPKPNVSRAMLVTVAGFVLALAGLAVSPVVVVLGGALMFAGWFLLLLPYMTPPPRRRPANRDPERSGENSDFGWLLHAIRTTSTGTERTEPAARDDQARRGEHPD